MKIPVVLNRGAGAADQPEMLTRAFNLLTATPERLVVERRAFDGKQFRPGGTEIFPRGGAGWERISAA